MNGKISLGELKSICDDDTTWYEVKEDVLETLYERKAQERHGNKENGLDAENIVRILEDAVIIRPGFAAQLFSKIDTNGNGTVDFEEFFEMVLTMRKDHGIQISSQII